MSGGEPIQSMRNEEMQMVPNRLHQNIEISTANGTGSERTSWLQIFRQFDDNNDGLISLNELKLKIGTATDQLDLSDKEKRRLFDGVDQNGDDELDFGEFCLLMTKAKRMRLINVVLQAARIVLPKSLRQEHFNYLQQYNCLPPPIFILTITLAEICVYAYYAATDPKGGVNISGPVPIYSPLIYNPQRRVEIWRFFTYMLIHIGIYHILFNALVQLILGVPLELVHKYWRVGVVYMAGVVAGSLASSVVDPSAFLAGASGGVYALLAAHGAHLVVNWAEMELAILRLVMLLVLIAGDISIAVYNRYSAENSTVSYAAHFGGFIAGLLTGILVLRNFRLKIWERVVWWIALFGVLSLTLICICFNVFYPQYKNQQKV